MAKQIVFDEEARRSLKAGVDILAESPTGSGKTLAFGLPVVERTAGVNARPGALVLVPTRELASQVVADLKPLAAARNQRHRTTQYQAKHIPPLRSLEANASDSGMTAPSGPHRPAA